MKRFVNPLLSLAAPLLITLAILGLLYRKGNERFQCLPALLVGGGLIISGAVGRRHRRNKLLMAIKEAKENQMSIM